MSSLWQICHITAESISSAEGEAACGEAAAPHAITGAVAPSRVGSPLGLVFLFPTHPARPEPTLADAKSGKNVKVKVSL